MKIIVVTHYWFPHHGGIEVVAAEQVRRLVDKGHEVTVVTSNIGKNDHDEKIHNYSVCRIRALNILEHVGIPYPIFSWDIFSILKDLLEKHDVIMVHGHSYIGSYVGALLAKKLKKPLLVLHHNQFVEYPFPWGFIERIVDKTIGRYTLSQASMVLATSEVTKGYAEDLVSDIDVGLLANGVDTERFTPAERNASEKKLRCDLGFSENDFIVLTVRRLVHRNGLDVLLGACSQLKEHHDVKCLIGGTGPELPNLQRIAEEKDLENVKFLGNISDDKLPEYYKIADLFTLPTRSGEGFGLVILEAFASALPVIATRSGGPEEIIDHGINGLLISVDSANELASSIIKLKMDKLMVEQMKKHAFCKSRKFSWDNNASILEKKLSELIN